MSRITDYVKSKGVKHPKGTDLEAVRAQLFHEYGFLTDRVQAATVATVIELPFNRIVFNEKHFMNIQSKSLRGKSAPIIGIVLETHYGYRLIDGHHRLKWMMEQEEKEGNFILLAIEKNALV